jgi:signal transduction histidine kinase
MSNTFGLENLNRIGPLAILEALGDAISIQDTDLKVIYQNPSHRKLMGNQLGRYCYDAYQKRDSACPDCHLLDSFKSGRTHRRETSSAHSSKGLVYVEITSTPLKNAEGRIIAGIEAVRDITERKLMSEKLRAITADLEQRSWKLMAANKELESFSYTLSHDIRNFITRISMASESLRLKFAGDMDETDRFLVANIGESCDELEKLVETVLLLCSSDSSRIVRENIDMTALAAEVADEINQLFPNGVLQFEIAPGMVASGDSQFIKLALQNLFSNARKYTANSPAPLVRFFAEEHDGMTVFVVKDNGCGFDAMEAIRLFKPFSRLSNSQDIKGTGVGLATVKRVIQAHDGEIWTESVPGKGASFYFTLSPRVQ